MSPAASRIDLPESIVSWVEDVAGASVVAADRHFAGASREAWNVDAGSGEGRQALFLLRDKGQGGGSARDAAVLQVLAESPVPVPRVVGLDPERSLILLERLPGRSDFPAVDHDSEREPTARHLMELTGQLHALEIAGLDIQHLTKPSSPEQCARPSLEQARNAYRALGDAADPFFGFALDWLDAHVPRQVSRYSLVHSDMGPGNFLYEGGRVTGIVDWEVAHFGDPMEDLAAVAVRDMATPIGDLPARFREYQASSGIPVVLSRVHYYRALVLVRNSLMIGLGLAHPAPGFDVVEMTMYQTLLMRAAALVLCDNLGVERPTVSSSVPAFEGGEQEYALSSSLIAAMRRDLEQEIVPVLEDPAARRSGIRIERGLETLEHEGRVGLALDERERRDLEAWLGEGCGDRLGSASERDRAIREQLAEMPINDDSLARAASYFAGRFHRLAERRRPLMGALFERLPQPLEEP